MLEKIFDQWADAMGGRKRLRAVQSISKRGRFYGFESQGEILEWAAVPGWRAQPIGSSTALFPHFSDNY